MKRFALLISVIVAVLAALAFARLPSDDVSSSRSAGDVLLKELLEPWFARHDGKDPLDDPEYREAMRSQWRKSTEAKYVWLDRKLKLSPELADRLYDLLVDQMFETLAGPVQSVRSENGVPIWTPEYQALKEAQDREVAALIGAAGLARLHEYDATFEYRNEVNRLQIRFGGDTEMLREDQVDAMIDILRDADAEMRRTKATPRQRDARVLRSAATVLSAPQLAVLDINIRREQGNWELSRLAREIVPAGKAAVARDPHAVTSYFIVGTNDDFLVKDPEYRRAWQAHKRLEVECTYLDVPRLLKLSPQTTDRFFDLLVDQQLARLDNPRGPYDAWDERLRKETREQSALLGARRLAQFHDWQNSSDYRRQVRYLQVEIGGGPDSLRESQAEALISVMYAASEEMRRGAPSLMSQFFTTRGERERQEAQRLELRRSRDARVRGSAETFLTPPQLAALDAWLQRDAV